MSPVKSTFRPKTISVPFATWSARPKRSGSLRVGWTELATSVTFLWGGGWRNSLHPWYHSGIMKYYQPKTIAGMIREIPQNYLSFVLFVLFDSPQMGSIMTPGNIAWLKNTRCFFLVYLHPKWWWIDCPLLCSWTPECKPAGLNKNWSDSNGMEFKPVDAMNKIIGWSNFHSKKSEKNWKQNLLSQDTRFPHLKIKWNTAPPKIWYNMNVQVLEMNGFDTWIWLDVACIRVESQKGWLKGKPSTIQACWII